MPGAQTEYLTPNERQALAFPTDPGLDVRENKRGAGHGGYDGDSRAPC